MRCPKCHYLSFEPEPRCKNCGYDLSFEPGDLTIASADAAPDGAADLDLPLRGVEPEPARSVADTLDVIAAAEDRPAQAEPVAAAPAAIRSAASARPVTPAPTPNPSPAPTAELPLFVQTRTRIDQDDPLVKLPRAPRAPLAVRRPTPAPGRVREKYQREVPVKQAGLLEPDLLDVRPRDDASSVPPVQMSSADDHAREAIAAAPAGALRRAEAALLDVLFLGAINLAVVWLTLQKCDLGVADAGQLPMLPLVAFLFLLDGGYLLMFTVTNGQTIGKMAAGLRVIDTTMTDRVSLRQAALRAVLTFPSVFALGLGFMPAVLGRGPALHDRLAHTRVVRA